MGARARSLVAPVVLATLAAGAVAYALFGIARQDEARGAREAADARLFTFDPADVVAITVEAKGDRTRLVRGPAPSGGAAPAWRLEAPVAAEADRGLVEELLRTLSGLSRKAPVAMTASGAELAPYGLASPRARVTVELAGGGSEGLAVGDENAFDGSLFVQGPRGGVDAVAGDLRYRVERGAFDFREKRVMRFAREAVARARFTVRDDRGATTSFEAAMDPSTGLAELLPTLSGLSATAFVDRPGAEMEAGLDRPSLSVVLLDGKGLELDRLDAAERDGKWFARSASVGVVAQVDPEALKALPRRAEELKPAPSPAGVDPEPPTP